MSSSGNNPMDGNVHVDEFVIGGKEKGKARRSYYTKKEKGGHHSTDNRGW